MFSGIVNPPTQD